MELSQLAPVFGLLGLLMALGVYRHVVAQPATPGPYLALGLLSGD